MCIRERGIYICFQCKSEQTEKNEVEYFTTNTQECIPLSTWVVLPVVDVASEKTQIFYTLNNSKIEYKRDCCLGQ